MGPWWAEYAVQQALKMLRYPAQCCLANSLQNLKAAFKVWLRDESGEGRSTKNAEQAAWEAGGLVDKNIVFMPKDASAVTIQMSRSTSLHERAQRKAVDQLFQYQP